MPYVIVAQQRPSYDKAADDELRQLDEALHGTDDPSALPNVVWDGTDDQDSIALDAVKVAISPKPNRASAETRS